MRIKVIHVPTSNCIDGIQLDRFRPGFQYEVGNTLGALFLAEGWADASRARGVDRRRRARQRR